MMQYLHCLPAKVNSEVTENVLDSPKSIVLKQAENRLHAQRNFEMVKYLVAPLILIFLGCEMNSEQLIKSENINFENINFNAVSKDLNFANIQEGPEVDFSKN